MLFSELENAARDLEAGEFEITKRSGQATVHWSGLYTVRGAIQAGRGKKGLYVIYRNGNVVDSGKAEVQDLATRLLQHYEYPLRHKENLNIYQIRLGIIRRASAVNLAEGTVTRSLAKRKLIPLRRPSLDTGKQTRVPNTAPFRTPPNRGVRIVHRGQMPTELRDFTTSRGGRAVQYIKPGTGSWEFPPPFLLSEAGLEQELEIAATTLEAVPTSEMEDTTAKRWHFWDAWVWVNNTWNRVETMGPVLDTRANGEQIRSTLLLRWQVRSPGKQVVARCFSWTGSQWMECHNHRF